MKRLILIIACVAAAIAADAKRYGSSGSKVENRVCFMFGAGESNTFTWKGDNTSIPIYDLPGAGLQAGFGYEFGKQNLFGGLNLQLDCSVHNQKANYKEEPRSGYLDKAIGTDDAQAAVSYHYIYNFYAEQQHQVSTGLLLYMGGDIGSRFYAMGGVKLSAMLYASHRSDIQLSTRKVYDDIVLPEVEEASDADGNYASHWVRPKPGSQYGWLTDREKGVVANPFRVTVGPVVEAGVRIPIRTSLESSFIRLGFFAEWGIPVLQTSTADVPLVDYSVLESRKDRNGLILMPDNREQLDRSIRVNSLLNSEFVSHTMALSLTQLTAGIRVSILLRPSSPLGKCHCLP